MDSSLISALAALAGALIGGLASLGSSWLTQRTEAEARRRESDRQRREALFGDFIDEATRLYGDALSSQKDALLDLVRLYAMLARIRLLASEAVIAEAEASLDAIIAAYLSPNRSLQDLQTLMAEGRMNFLLEFSRACRGDLTRLGGAQSGRH